MRHTVRWNMTAGVAAFVTLALGSARQVAAQSPGPVIERHTATAHPMHYLIALPNGWTATRRWPVVVVIPDANREFDNVARLFAAARGSQPFIIVVPLVLSGGGTARQHMGDFDYSTATWAFADSAGNCAFDDAGMTAVLRDLREKFSADDRTFVTGWEAGGHVVLAQLFAHPDRYRGAVAVTPNFQGRCVTSIAHAPASTAAIPVRGFHGSSDAGWSDGSPLRAQWPRADSAARARGFTNVTDTLIVGQGHGPMPAEVLGFFASLVAAPAAARAQPADTARAVLVTGASSGIGRKITERLASHGFFVYAGARAQKDLDDLNAIRNVQAIRLDVTVPADIAAAVATVTRAGRGLHGVVNNAGVAIVAPLIEVEEKELDFIFNVNIYGPYRITRAFAPLLLESKGRVVNISSLNGIVASPMIGPYSMSKHAIEAYGDGLAAELARFGVRVSLIEPGNYRSEIGRNLLARWDSAVVTGSRFESQIRGALNSMRSFENNPEPDDVADAALDALSSPNPKPRYLVVPAANQAALTIRRQLDILVQLNEGHKFTYDRDTLVKMLDEALARAKQRR
jgi:NAD(P)-dependent dehydrogenase (short-subunit alcohol dehydrogenase family)